MLAPQIYDPSAASAAAGELVIIDVNFFPSYKGHPEAPGAVRAALRDQHRRWQATAEGALH